MSTLDPRTIIVIAVLTSALMAVVLAFMRASYPRSIHGLGLWATAAATWVIAAIFFSIRDADLPQSVVVVIPNLLLLAGSIAYLAGCQRFFDQPVQWRWWGGFLALTLLILFWNTDVRPDFVGRLITVTLAVGLVYTANLWFLQRQGARGLPVMLIKIVLLVHLLVIVARAGTALVGKVSDHLYEASLVQIIYLTSFVVCQLLYCIGAILMATDRLATEYARQARFDPLTDIHNRRALLESCGVELSRSQRTGRGCALMMLDLDHFKAINDQHGHQHGDLVLRRFATQVQAAIRPTDHVGRYGGEEFAVLLPETDLQAAQAIAQRIHAVTRQDDPLDCTVSIGITTWQGDSDTVDAMFTRADRALYQAKEQGRNRTCVA